MNFPRTDGMLLPFTHHAPRVGHGAVLAGRSAVIGRAELGARLVLGPYATLRADGERIEVGNECFFAERSTLHIAHGLLPCIVGDRVAVGRYALVHACRVGNDVAIGDAAVVMDGAAVGDGVIIAAGSLVPPRKQLEGGWLYGGNPAAPVRRVTKEEVEQARRALSAGEHHEIMRGEALPAMEGIDGVPAPNEGTSFPGRAGPRMHGTAYVAPTAILADDVRLDEQVGVWFGCTLRAGGATISVGARSNIQDNSFLVADARYGAIEIGRGVTIGHNVRLGACRIGDGSLIGMGCELEHGVVVEQGGCVGARAYVRAGSVVKAGQIWAGRPARPFRPVSDAEREGFSRIVGVYAGYAEAYPR